METKKDSWIPKNNLFSMNNKSSVVYNIVAPDKENKICGFKNLSVSQSKVYNMKRGVSEIYELTKNFAPNYSKKYAESFKENKNIFKVYNGIFSKVHDSAYRNGDLVKPFCGRGMGKPHDVLKQKAYIQTLRQKEKYHRFQSPTVTQPIKVVGAKPIIIKTLSTIKSSNN